MSEIQYFSADERRAFIAQYRALFRSAGTLIGEREFQILRRHISEAIESGKVFLLPVDFNLSAYKNMLDDGQLLHSMFNSVIVTVVGTCLNMIFTTTAAYALSKKRLHGRNIIMKLMVFTMMFSGGTIPHFILVQSLGLMNSYWALWLPGLITIYNLIVMKTFFEGLPESLE